MVRSFARKIVPVAIATSALALAQPALAQGCTREAMQEIADSYIKAQTEGKPFSMALGEWVDYRENMAKAALGGGIVSQPLTMAWHNVLLDPAQCRAYVEYVVTEPVPYVIAARVDSGFFGTGPIHTLVTDEGDWLFDAKKTYEYARREDWSEIPADQRNTRKEIQAAADAYLDSFNDKSVQVPWGTPCARLEGGIYTGKGEADDSCDVGVPEGIELVDRNYIIDEAKGSVAVWLRFGGPEGLPDIHTFRIEQGKIRYVHTLTNCGEQVNCGFPPLEEMLAGNPAMQPDPQAAH